MIEGVFRTPQTFYDVTFYDYSKRLKTANNFNKKSSSVGIYMFKVNKRNTRTRFEISHLVLVFLLLTLSR